MPESAASPSSLRSTTCSSSASSTGLIVSGKSCPNRVRLAVPPIMIRSSVSSTSVSSRVASTVETVPRSSASKDSGRSCTSRGTSAKRRPTTRLLSRARRSASDVSPNGAGQSIMPLLDPPGVGDQHEHQPGGREREQLHVPHRERVSDGYCTTATCRVSCASSRTVRATTSSRSTAPSRKFWIARRSADDSGLTPASLSTNSR